MKSDSEGRGRIGNRERERQMERESEIHTLDAAYLESAMDASYFKEQRIEILNSLKLDPKNEELKKVLKEIDDLLGLMENEKEKKEEEKEEEERGSIKKSRPPVKKNQKE
eukprot:TRINITY_DN827_c0_g2_i1.p2 TRINITY_DN827_c0_g2~~TRINITY_DN827_c0_g2_i1.p2  ORF type:complete len:110 (-),score=56.75 TRINITY_DN827_c0_g2_i1:60-389(-)